MQIQTTPDGRYVMVGTTESLPSHPKRQFVSDITEASMSRIICALSRNTIDWRKSAEECPNLKELSDKVTAENEMAASELGELGQYRYIIHCMTH